MRPLSEYDPYDTECTFWKERLSIDDDGYYVITILLSDLYSIGSPESTEFPIVISNYGYYDSDSLFYYNYETNKSVRPLYFPMNKIYRRPTYPLDLSCGGLPFDLDHLCEKIIDLNSDIVIHKMKDNLYDSEYHPVITITERIKSYNLSGNLCLQPMPLFFSYIHVCLDIVSNSYQHPLDLIYAPIFTDLRLDFYMYDGSIKSFYYCYAPGDAVTEYLYYARVVLECLHSIIEDACYIPVLHTFGVGDYPLSVYIGFPAIGDEIIYPGGCMEPYTFSSHYPYDYPNPQEFREPDPSLYPNPEPYKYPFNYPYPYPENFFYITVLPHMVSLDPTIIKTDNILWGV